MSGGSFSVNPYTIKSLADSIIERLNEAIEYAKKNSYHDLYELDIDSIEATIKMLSVSYARVRVLDLILAGDSGPDSYKEDLKEMVLKYREEYCEEFKNIKNAITLLKIERAHA